MVNAFHGQQTVAQGIHGIVFKTYTDAYERESDGPWDDGYKYKVALQDDTNQLWIVTDNTTPAWRLLASLDGETAEVQVRKSTAGSITSGQAVYIAGYDDVADEMLVELALADDASTMPVIGITTEIITDSNAGTIRTAGIIDGLIDTSGRSVGDLAYASTVVAGDVTYTQPSLPNQIQEVWRVARVGNPGTVYVSLSPITGDIATQGANVGGGAEVFRDKVLDTLNFRTLIGLNDIDVSVSGDSVLIDGLNLLPLDGSRSMTGNLDMDGYDILNANLLGTVDGYDLSIIFGNKSDPSGFPDRTTSTISVDAGTRTFTIAPVSGSYSFLIAGNLVTKTTSDSLVFPNTEGLHFFWFDEDAVLQQSTNEADFDAAIGGKSATVAAFYWDTTNSQVILLGEERHGLMDNKAHVHFHLAFGSQWYSGGALGDITADGSGDLAIHAQFSVSAVSYADEDIRYNISDGNPQTLAFPAEIPIYYRSGVNGDWRKKAADVYPLIYSGTAGFTGASGRPAWNEFTGATWQLTTVNNNDFFLVHYFGTNDINEPIIGIQGQSDYATIGDARTGAETEISNLSETTEILSLEFVRLGTVIYQTTNSYLNTPKVRIVSTDTGDDYIDFRGASVRGSGASISDHGSLSGLGDDDHTQYLLVSGTRAMTGALDMGTFAITNVGTVDGVDVSAHASRHENGGADEISVTGLSGLLADPQTPTTHATTHENGGSDEINVAGLSGLLADAQTPLSHAATHENGGVDEINVVGLSGLLADPQTPLAHASSHQAGGSDELDGYDLAFVYVPNNYIAPSGDVLGEHIAAIDNALGNVVLDHGVLTGLADDDHTQYLLVSGTRAMSGALNMGTFAITNVGNVDGRDVSADGSTLDSHVSDTTIHFTADSLDLDGYALDVDLQAHINNTNNPHSTDIGNLGSGTLAELNAIITDATLDDSSASRIPTAHASSHENGGSDEINVQGLGGLLADAQTPLSHASTHQNGGVDEISVQGLSGELADPQKVTVRKNTGANVGSQSRLNFIEGNDISLTITEDAPNNEIDITIASTFAESVSSVFGRTGDVVATASDYDASQIDNDSTKVSGTYVSNALDSLATIIDGYALDSDLQTHISDTANPHLTSIANIGSGTLAQLNAAITDATLDDVTGARAPTSHATTHENGGSDEISVAGLSGLLADPQTPLGHAATHVLGGSDEIDGDELDVDFTPSNYTPATGSPGSNVDHLAAHLRGIDAALGSVTLDHGALSGLGDDDHTQYLLVDGTRPMNGNLDMDGYNILDVEQVDFVPVDPDTIIYQEGRIFYDSNDKTLAVTTNQTGVLLQVGHELHIRIVNNTGSTITDGQAVHLSGAQGNRPTVELADGTSSFISHGVGLATHDIDNGQEGLVTAFGLVRGFDTSGFNAGDSLYVDPTTPGGLTNVKPTNGDFVWEMGVALNSTNNGAVFVSPTGPTELADLHDTNIIQANLQDGYYITYDTGFWRAAVFEDDVLALVGSGLGDVIGPDSATDNAIARFDTTGKLIQNSTVTLDDSGNMSFGSGTANFGTNPATTGAINLSNNQLIAGRNAANTANFNLIRATASDRIAIGQTANVLGLEVDGTTSHLFQIANTTYVTITAADTTFAHDVDMGSNNITNVGTVDGVDVSAHATRHESGGADEIDGYQLAITYAPTNYGTPSSDILGQHLFEIDTQLGIVESSIVTDHGGLTGLGDDDHTQYLLVDGTRAMTGALDMGTNNITNVGTVDGRDVSADGSTLDSHVADNTIHFTAISLGLDGYALDADLQTHIADTANPHSTSIANLGSGTLAQLNAIITDATLDDSSSSRTPTAHASTHITGAGDEIDGDQLDIDFTPSNYTPTTSPAEVTNLDHLSAHLAGIDTVLGTVVTDHGGLTGLGDDDHTQYLLIDGTRAMSGALDMGTNNITNVGTVDGRDISTDGSTLDSHIADSTIHFTAESLGLDGYATDAELLAHTSDTNNPHSTTLANLTDTDLTGIAQGNILYRNATQWVVLAPGTSGQFLQTQGAGANPQWSSPSGSGDVVGPASATDNAIARFDTTTGKLIQNSAVTIDDSGNMALGSGNITTTGTVDGVDVSAHATRHEDGGADEIDGYNVAMVYTPTNYTAPTNNVIGEHIAKIDDALAGGGGGGVGPSILQPFSYTVTDTTNINVYQNGNVWFTYFLCDHDITATGMKAHVSQGGSGTAWAGIYNSDGSTLLAEDSTGTSTSSTGMKDFTFDSSVSLSAGTGYYLAITTSGNGSLFTGLSVSSSNVSPLRSGTASSGNNPSTGLPSTVTIGNAQLSAVWLAVTA